MLGFYIVMLFVSGGITLAVAIGVPQLGLRSRISNGVVGALFLAYGIDLLVDHQSGTYRIYLWVFVLPVAVIVEAMVKMPAPTPPVDDPDEDDSVSAETVQRSSERQTRRAERRAGQLAAMRAKRDDAG